MVRLNVRDYSVHTPVQVERVRSGGFRTSAKRLALISEHPIQGSAFDAKKVMDWLVYGENAKYYV